MKRSLRKSEKVVSRSVPEDKERNLNTPTSAYVLEVITKFSRESQLDVNGINRRHWSDDDLLKSKNCLQVSDFNHKLFVICVRKFA